MKITVEINERDLNRIFAKRDEEAENLISQAMTIGDAELESIVQSGLSDLSQERRTNKNDYFCILIGALKMYDYLLEKMEIE